MLPKTLRFCDFDGDSEVVAYANPSIVLTYATKLLNDGLDMTARNEVVSVEKLCKEAMERFKAKTF